MHKIPWYLHWFKFIMETSYCVYLKKIRRSIGILSKIHYFVDTNILTNLYFALIYPSLIYGLILAWGNTYPTTHHPLFVLQKRAIRLITFSKFDEHSSPLFKLLNIIKLHDLVTLHIAIFMFKFHNQLLPSVFNTYFTAVDHIHKYNTRSAAGKSYYLPTARTNYGKFNIRFQGPKIWNSIFAEHLKSPSLRQFKKNLKNEFLKSYWWLKPLSNLLSEQHICLFIH